MNVAALADSLPFSSNSKNVLRTQWDWLSRIPGGNIVFSKLVAQAAPYTGSIGPIVEDVRIGYSRVRMADRRAVRNHLNSIHAVALANLAEFTGNLALAYSLPNDARFIVAGMSVEYLRKARGTIRGVCQSPVPATSERREYLVEVSILNETGDEVTRATLRSLVSPKKKP